MDTQELSVLQPNNLTRTVKDSPKPICSVILNSRIPNNLREICRNSICPAAANPNTFLIQFGVVGTVLKNHTKNTYASRCGPIPLSNLLLLLKQRPFEANRTHPQKEQHARLHVRDVALELRIHKDGGGVPLGVVVNLHLAPRARGPWAAAGETGERRPSNSPSSPNLSWCPPSPKKKKTGLLP